MIRFSKREDYAVILISVLAKEYKKRLVPISEVAKKYNISLLFLRNLATDLRNAEIIKAVEGKNGGYFLGKSPKKLTMGEVLNALHQKSLLLCCPTGEKHKGKCPRTSYCQAGHIWRKVNQEFLGKITKLTVDQFMHYAD